MAIIEKFEKLARAFVMESFCHESFLSFISFLRRNFWIARQKLAALVMVSTRKVARWFPEKFKPKTMRKYFNRILEFYFIFFLFYDTNRYQTNAQRQGSCSTIYEMEKISLF